MEADAASEDEPLVEFALGWGVAFVAIVLHARRSALDGLCILATLTGTFNLNVTKLTMCEIHLARLAIEEVAHASLEIEVIEIASRNITRSRWIKEEKRSGSSHIINSATVTHIGIAKMTLVAASQQDARSLDMLEIEAIELTIRTTVEP